MSSKGKEIKTIAYEDAVKLVRHSPFKEDRRDIIVRWGYVVPVWHWSRRTDLTKEAAISYHRRLNEAVICVEAKVQSDEELPIPRSGRRKTRGTAAGSVEEDAT